MSMRIFDKKIAGLALLPLIAMLAACGSGAEDEAEKPVGAAERTAEQNASAKPDNEGKIDCAINGAQDMARICSVEWLTTENGREMIVRHDDGGFRRFQMVTDGRGLITADGSEDATITLNDQNEIIVSVGGDKYRLPATIKQNPAQ